MVQKLNLWVKVLYLCLATTLPIATAITRLEDKRALLAFKDLISSNQGLLASWAATTDPCTNSWSGVSCHCSDLQPPLSAAACDTATAGRNDAVTQLDLVAFSSLMAGELVPELGDLTYLQSLRLDGQAFQVNVLSATRVHVLASLCYYGWQCTAAM